VLLQNVVSVCVPAENIPLLHHRWAPPPLPSPSAWQTCTATDRPGPLAAHGSREAFVDLLGLRLSWSLCLGVSAVR
jgi:hypothetical protein